MSKHKHHTGPPCTRCTMPAAGAYLCTHCGHTLEQALADVPALAADLDLTRSRQDRMRGHAIGTPGHSTAGPLWDERASRATRTLHTALAGEARQLATALNHPPPPGTIPALAAYLLASVPAIRHTDTAAATVDTLVRVVTAARRAVDRPPDLVFGGPCDHCGADLYTHGNADHFTCPSCGTIYGFEQRRAWLLTATADSLLTATEASRALSDLLGRSLSPNTIRTWANTGRLTPHGRHGDRPLYRVGDLVALARTTPTRQRRPVVA
ncbi:MAG: helix-turn-helix domain-containing protein [Pseudonocardiaceae bacterium]